MISMPSVSFQCAWATVVHTWALHLSPKKPQSDLGSKSTCVGLLESAVSVSTPLPQLGVESGSSRFLADLFARLTRLEEESI